MNAQQYKELSEKLDNGEMIDPALMKEMDRFKTDLLMRSGFITDFDSSDETYKQYLGSTNTIKTPYSATGA